VSLGVAAVIRVRILCGSYFWIFYLFFLFSLSDVRQNVAVRKIFEKGDLSKEQFHQYCYNQFTHSGTLKSIKRKSEEKKVDDQSRTTDELEDAQTGRSSTRKRCRGGN